MADNLAFVGTAGERSREAVARLTAAQPTLAAQVDLVPGVEVRSTTNLVLASDWNLMPTSGARAGAPMALTLRAAGNLSITNSISDGFAGAAAATDRNAIAANGVAVAEGASIRLVGGADLSAANPMSVRTDGVGNLTIGRAAARAGTRPPSVFVRTTTGDIDMAAAGDLQQLNSQARVYTTGTPVQVGSLPEYERLVFPVNQLAPGSATGTFSGPFYENAGDLSLHAGGDVLGAPGTTYSASGAVASTQFVTDWWYRRADPTSLERSVVLWSRYDLFGQGFASFGGGDIRVRAGRDVVDLELSTPATGYSIDSRVADSGSEAAAAQRWFQGGLIDVMSDRDVVSGIYNAGGPQARLVAGERIVGATEGGPGTHPVTQILYLNTDWDIRAARSLSVGSLTNPALLQQQRQGVDNATRPNLIDGLAAGARAQLVSLTGDLELAAGRPSLDSLDRRFSSVGSGVLPDDLQLIAFSGSIKTAPVVQRPKGDARLEYFASGDVSFQSLLVSGSGAASKPTSLTSNDLSNALTPGSQGSSLLPDASARPVHVVSASGNLTSGGGFSDRPLRLVALRDVTIDGGWLVQHAPNEAGRPNELTLLQAGRDVRFGGSGSLRVGGQGDVLVVAGRDANLAGSAGIVTVGNQDNPRGLPAGGASVTVLASVTLGDADYRRAVDGQFHLVGGGLENFSGELVVQLEALRAGQPLLAEGAMRSAADAFAASPAEAREARVRSIVGADNYAGGVEDYVAAALARIDRLATDSNALQPGQARAPGSQFVRGANTSLSADQVRAQLRTLLAEHAYGELLVRHIEAGGYDEATRSALTLSISPYRQRLVDFMQRQGAPAGLAGAEAAQRFINLAPERQVLFLNEVLFEELRTAGREATQGDRVAYLRGYAALDALFPNATNRGSISLSNSQIKTQQGGDIRMVVPGGGINIGELGAAGNNRNASDLGVVTVAGGRVEAAVRDNLDVNQSRVFTLARGDLLLWSSLGNLDAGRGAKTVTGSPPPLFTINDKGQLVVDTSGSFSGSGIAVLDSASSLDLYAPLGEINAGDAGIQSRGITFLGADRISNADALNLSGPTVGAPPPAPTSSANAALGATAQSAAGAGSGASEGETEEEKRRKRRARRDLMLEFLGFGERS